MMRRGCLCAVVVAAASLAWTANADAGERQSSAQPLFGQLVPGHVARNHRYSRRSGTRVRGYVVRRGGYSYFAEDVINTYGDSRTKYVVANTYRDPFLDRQTPAGPFDHGFFFDSGIAPRGGDSPYMN